MAKLDIFKQEWLEMLFEGRNKNYGAYELRSESPKVLTRSFLIGAAVFCFGIASPLIFSSSEEEEVIQDAVLVDMADIALPDIPETPEVPEELPPPPPPPMEEPAKSVNDQVKFTEPEIVKAEEVKEEVATVEELQKADPGQKTQEGDKEKGEIKVNENTGTADKGQGAPGGDGDGNRVFTIVEKQAGPPGGLQSFYKSFAQKYNAPEVDEGVRQIRVILSFVVEKDGSFTDIKVARDPGYGAGKEAIRVLKSMPKWAPAEQNNRKVRSQFNLPITINVQ